VIDVRRVGRDGAARHDRHLNGAAGVNEVFVGQLPAIFDVDEAHLRAVGERQRPGMLHVDSNRRGAEITLADNEGIVGEIDRRQRHLLFEGRKAQLCGIVR
jgi:hypothetical protein